MSETSEMKEQIEARVAEKKAEYLNRKEKFKGKAIKISEEILKGIEYTELAYVKLVNGQMGEIDIRPLAEGECMAIFAEVGLDVVETIGSGEFNNIEDYMFFWSVVSQSTGLPIDLIKKSFAVGESAILAVRILEMSGLSETAETEVEDF